MKLSLKSLGLSKKYAVIILIVLLTLLIFIGPTCSSFSESVVPYNSVIEGMLEGPNYEYVNLAGCTFQQADMYSTTDKPSILLQLHGPNDIIQPTGLQELLNSKQNINGNKKTNKNGQQYSDEFLQEVVSGLQPH